MKRMKPCPVGDIADDPHFFKDGTGVAITWDVMGDPDSVKIVCPNCARLAKSAATYTLSDAQIALYEEALRCGAGHEDALDAAGVPADAIIDEASLPTV
ncbi:MAG: hypothetical protein EBT83_13770 [Betaproteobacteria bacterium]|nr:hypothetical protein [Betaproteobacteria bacterium]